VLRTSPESDQEKLLKEHAMIEQRSSPSFLETCLPLKAARSALPLPPRKNRLLQALPVMHYERLVPHLQLVPLNRGSTIYGVGDREKYLYFIIDGLVSQMQVTASGASAESTVTGREGVIGIASFLGGESSFAQTLVVGAGHAYRLPGTMLKGELASGGPLLHVLLRYTHSLIARCVQMAVCNLHHALEQRLCRWISSSVDRLPGNDLTITHAQLGVLLGVRRESVTEALGKLEQQGIVHHSRGQMTVLARSRLEALACECYGFEKHELARPLGPPQTHPQQCVEMLHVLPLLRQVRDVATPLQALS
jgi:CRP-like cAMP-binding protein